MLFSRETTELATPKVKIVTKISKWEKYECTEFGEMKYIHGFNSNTADIYKFKPIESPFIL